VDAAFIAKMEDVLNLYAQPFDPKQPVVCFDERPCFLIGETVEGLEMKAGKAAREHYAYKKNGSCALLMSIEPKTGKRVAHLFDRRTKREYAEFMKELAASYPEAKKIRVVQDNLKAVHRGYTEVIEVPRDIMMATAAADERNAGLRVL